MEKSKQLEMRLSFLGNADTGEQDKEEGVFSGCTEE
jgi:hypothetical protein